MPHGTPFDDEHLIAYATGELSDEMASAVARHLETAPDDDRLVRRIRALVDRMKADDTRLPREAAIRRAVAAFRRDEPVRDHRSWLEPVERLVAALVFDSMARPAVAGFRGGPSTGRQLAFARDGDRIDVQIAPAGQRDRFSLLGAVLLEDGEPGEAVLLRHGTDEALESAWVDETGRFTMECEPGTYDLLVAIDDARTAVVARDLTIGP